MADDRAQTLRALQDALDAPPEAATRNINRDVHQGGFPQRPYHRVEDRLGALTRGYQSYDEIPSEAGVYRNDKGNYVRRVMVSTGDTALVGGALAVRKVPQERTVALTLDMAKAARADFYQPGLGWIREGRKPERDMAVEAQGTALLAGQEEWEPLGASEQAIHQQQQAQAAAARPAIPTVEAPKTDSGRKKES